MNFASIHFIFFFVPLFYLAWHAIVSKTSLEKQLIAIILFSLLFYGYFVPAYIILIVGSILFNYLIANRINNLRENSYINVTLAFGIFINLILLGYYKYTNFFIEEINILFKTSIDEKSILLPLAISFFTFQQIGFLMDVYYKKVKNFSFIRYFAFVTFFPQLIAGPIIKYNLMTKEFDGINLNYNKLNFSIGMCIFIIGLAKKVIVADNLGFHADYFFSAVENGDSLSFIGSWIAALLFTVQIYFDFSGYCDMAFGLAKMAGLTIPINFNSPYKAKNLIDYWQRWHITLSKFLTEYIHLPLSVYLARSKMNHIVILILVPILTTFAISGMWHGAGRTFLIWGLMHGAGVSFNHLVKSFKKRRISNDSAFTNFLKITTTFIFVTFTMVMFRSQTIDDGFSIYKSMIGINGISIPYSYIELQAYLSTILPFINFQFEGYLNISPLGGGNLNFFEVLILLFISLFLIFVFPNTYQIANGLSDKITHEKISKPKFVLIKENKLSLMTLSFLAVLSFLMMNASVQFIYFQF